MDFLLTGTHEARVDDRKRIAVPSKLVDGLRKMIDSEKWESVPVESVEVVVGLGLEGKVCIFPKNVHRDLVEFLQAKPRFDPVWNQIRAGVIGTADPQVLDRQSRVRVLPALAKHFDLTGDVVVQGVGDKMEIVSAKAWEAAMNSFNDVVAKAFAVQPQQ